MSLPPTHILPSLIFLFRIIHLHLLKGRKRHEEISHSPVHFAARLGQPKDRCWGLSLGLLCGRQGPNDLSHRPLPVRVHMSRKLDQKWSDQDSNPGPLLFSAGAPAATLDPEPDCSAHN